MKLHIGGNQPHPDWNIFDIESRPEVDFVGDANDLSQFADNSIAEIYASHVLEHFHYGLDDELAFTLAEWHRVLQPEGKLYISVPNLEVLCWLYLHPDLSAEGRYQVMRMMFGGQVNPYDVHRVGFDEAVLSQFLRVVGFASYERVADFGLFQDTSTMTFLNYPISLNMIAYK